MSNTMKLAVCAIIIFSSQLPSIHGKLAAEYWQKKFSMTRNIEGGYFYETYRSNESYDKLPERYGINATRTFSTHIYYMLENEEFSVFHRLETDEIWHHYMGATCSLYIIDHVTRELKVFHLGRAARQFVATVKTGDWYAAKLRSPGVGKYCLLGITVAPGFEIEDYYESKREELIALYPEHSKIITKLTKN